MIGTCPTIGETGLIESGSWPFTEVNTGQDQTDFNNANKFEFPDMMPGIWEIDFSASFDCFTEPGSTQQSPIVDLDWIRSLNVVHINKYSTNPDVGGENSACPLPVVSDFPQILEIPTGCASCGGSNLFLFELTVSVSSILDIQAGAWTFTATRISEG